MANIGVSYEGGITRPTIYSGSWWILKGTKENDNITSSGTYPANETDHELRMYGYGGNDTIQLGNGHKPSAIYGGNGNDSIKNWSSDAFINGDRYWYKYRW